jgi:S1/P1 Nuclease
MRAFRTLVALTFVFVLAGPTQAWWEEGHVALCKIAEAHLTPAARTAIAHLLGDMPISDPRVCLWADQLRTTTEFDKKYPHHATWHYINLEVQLRTEEFKPDASGDHVIGAIEHFQKVLTDPCISKGDREEALMFVVHFVGDLHQPLHCLHRNDDRGGNLQPIKSVLGVAEDKLNLHKVWDGHLVKADRGDLTVPDYAKRLADEITAADKDAWQKGCPREWAWEVHLVGVKSVYLFADGIPLPKPSEPAAELGEENYFKANRPVVHEQLKKAGVRLAKVLNDCFEKPHEGVGVNSR